MNLVLDTLKHCGTGKEASERDKGCLTFREAELIYDRAFTVVERWCGPDII